jgi:DNA-binding MarR family transcriptional regulator
MFLIYRSINKLANKQRRNFEHLTFPKSFSAAQGRILHFLLNNPSKEIFQKDLEEEFGLRPPSATALLKSIEKMGLIHRAPSETDGRYKKIVTTPKAFQYAPELNEQLKILEQRLLKDIDPKELAVWEKVTQQLMQNLDE